VFLIRSDGASPLVISGIAEIPGLRIETWGTHVFRLEGYAGPSASVGMTPIRCRSLHFPFDYAQGPVGMTWFGPGFRAHGGPVYFFPNISFRVSRFLEMLRIGYCDDVTDGNQIGVESVNGWERRIFFSVKIFVDVSVSGDA
jgi:hypothetical protein